MKIKRFIKGSLLGILLAFGLLVSLDAIRFHEIQRGNYNTPWYDARWWREPYTNIRVQMAGASERWTKNATGDDWLVREANISGKEWWTVLKTIER